MTGERWKRLPEALREDMDLDRAHQDHPTHPANEGDDNNNDDDDHSNSNNSGGASGRTSDSAREAEKALLADVEPHKRPGISAARQDDLVTRGLKRMKEEARLEARQKAIRRARKQDH